MLNAMSMLDSFPQHDLGAAEIKLGKGRFKATPREDGFEVACAPEDLPKGMPPLSQLEHLQLITTFEKSCLESCWLHAS